MSTVERTVPQYQRIASELMEMVRSGEYPVGSRLPGELDLRDRYAVSRHTVREALRLLENAGYISRSKGIGTTVLRSELPPAAETDPALEALHAFLRTLTSETVEGPNDGLTPDLATHMSVPTSVQWRRIDLRRNNSATGNLVCVSEMFVHPGLAPSLTEFDVREQPLYDFLLERNGETLTTIECEFRTDPPRESLQKLDGYPTDRALNIVRRFYGRRNGLFLATSCTFPNGTFSCAVDFAA